MIFMKDNQWSINSILGFVLSLISIIVPFVSILGLIFSIIGVRSHKKGRGLAIAGIIISSIMLILLLTGAGWIILQNIIRDDSPEKINIPFDVFLSLIK